jgi:hypothetical protein
MISRYAPLFFGLILGIALGLVYGWVISPSEYTGSSPEALREDYRIDFTLMIAKAYSNDNDLAQAKHPLKIRTNKHCLPLCTHESMISILMILKPSTSSSSILVSS